MTRRLNRAEYNFTVNDLLGTNLDFKDKMPTDNTAFGFDNIGEAQTLSPALLARFMDLAEFAVGQAILTGGRPLPRIPVDFKLEQQIEKSERFGVPTAAVDAPAGIPKDHGEHVDLMYELMALAFQTDSTRVITFPVSPEGSNRTFV
ncbi:MAG: DUF1587 domain-containing protein, partial [Opitutaceae bacterium]